MGPVTNSPRGTTTLPPPLATQASIAFRNASEQSVVPSPLAPQATTSTSFFGKEGGMILKRIAPALSHASGWTWAPDELENIWTRKKVADARSAVFERLGNASDERFIGYSNFSCLEELRFSRNNQTGGPPRPPFYCAYFVSSIFRVDVKSPA